MTTLYLSRAFAVLCMVTVLLSPLLTGSCDAQTVNATVVNFSPGGQNVVNMDDTSNGVGNDFSIYQDVNDFDFDTATQIGAFSLAQTANTNTLRLDGFGVGVGTNPFAEFHLLGGGSSPFTNSRLLVENVGIAQDRTLLDLQNNGAVVINLLDNSAGIGSAPFVIRSADDRLSIQKAGGATQAGMTIFADGNIRYSINGIPNLTVKPNGNMNIIGQTGGGNLNVLGPAGGAGNLFVKGNITYNGTLSGPSDRNLKENFAAVDPAEILEKVVGLPISRWNYKSDQKDTPHIGPMAQDFASAFQVGNDNRRIPLMDSDGIALAAIQGLNQVVEAKQDQIKRQQKDLEQQLAQIQTLETEMAEQSQLIEDLAERLKQLEASVRPIQK